MGELDHGFLCEGGYEIAREMVLDAETVRRLFLGR
jgi:hypothetical protein